MRICDAASTLLRQLARMYKLIRAIIEPDFMLLHEVVDVDCRDLGSMFSGSNKQQSSHTAGGSILFAIDASGFSARYLL